MDKRSFELELEKVKVEKIKAIAVLVAKSTPLIALVIGFILKVISK